MLTFQYHKRLQSFTVRSMYCVSFSIQSNIQKSEYFSFVGVFFVCLFVLVWFCGKKGTKVFSVLANFSTCFRVIYTIKKTFSIRNKKTTLLDCLYQSIIIIFKIYYYLPPVFPVVQHKNRAFLSAMLSRVLFQQKWA